MKITTDLSGDDHAFLKNVIGFFPYDEPWACDPRAIFHDDIVGDMERLTPDYWFPASDFAAAPTTLTKLIIPEIRRLASDPALASISSYFDRLVVLENHVPDPDAQILRSPYDNRRLLLIFHSPVIHFMNSFFADYGCCLSFYNFHKSFEYRVASENLFSFCEGSYINDILESGEVVASREHITRGNRIQRCYSPIDLCQRVEGGRLFLIAHELAHILHDIQKEVSPSREAEGRRIIAQDGDAYFGHKLSDEQIYHYEVETFCDAVAAHVVFRRAYQDYIESLSGDERTGRYGFRKLVNNICGIALLFVMYEVFSVAVSSISESTDYTAILKAKENALLHPAPRHRLPFVGQHIRIHEDWNWQVQQAARVLVSDFNRTIGPFLQRVWDFVDAGEKAQAANFTPEKFREGQRPRSLWDVRQMFKTLKDGWQLKEIREVAGSVEMANQEIYQLGMSDFQERFCENLGKHIRVMLGDAKLFWKWTI